MRFGTRTVRHSLFVSVFVITALLLTSACGSDSTPSSDSTFTSVPQPGAPAALTAQQIFDRAQEELDSVVAFRSDGGFVYYGTDEDIQTGTFTTEWTTPDRTRQVYEQGPITAEILDIGGSRYQRNLPDQVEWREVNNSSGELVPSPGEFLSELNPTGAVEVVEHNGAIAYKISGHPDPEEGNPYFEATVTDTVFIDASSFLILTFERVMVLSPSETESDPPDLTSVPPTVTGPDGETFDPTDEDEGFRTEIWLEFTYLDEPLVINAPENYVPYQEPASNQWYGADSSPTPFAGDRSSLLPDGPVLVPERTDTPHSPSVIRLSTPTPTPVLPSKARPEDPFYNIESILTETPEYDRLQLANVTVIYTSCDPAKHTGFEFVLDRPGFYGDPFS